MTDFNKIKRVALIRDSIAGVVTMLSGKDIKVIQAGNKAAVTYNKGTGEPEVVYLPIISEKTSDQMLDAIQGFLDHEVAHILFSDQSVIDVASKENIGALQNIIEDTFIERKMSERFKGSRSNIEKMRHMFTNMYIDSKLEELNKNPNSTEKDYWGQLVACACRAWAGQQYFIDYMKDKWQYIESIADKLSKTVEGMSTLNSSQECLDMTRAMKKVLMDDTPEGNNESQDENNESQNENDDSGQESNENSEKGEGSEGEGSEGEGESGTSNEDPDYAADKDESESESEEARANPFDQSNEAPEFNENDFKNVQGFDEALEEMIEELCNMDLDREDYKPFSTDWDDISPLNVTSDVSSVIKEMQEDLNEHIRKITRDMERMFVANNKARWERGRSSGRLNSTALARLASDDARVFKVLKEQKTKEVAISLLVDCSGSMGGNKIKLAFEVAWAMSEVLDKLKIANEVIGFTDDFYGENPNYDEVYREFCQLSSSQRSKYTRHRGLYMPIFKSFNERFSLETRKRMAFAGESKMRMGSNVDGESLIVAASRLAKQKEPGKTIIVLSDGSPAVAGCDHRLAYKHLKDSVKAIQKGGINCIGIGIKSNSVKEFYPKNVVVDNLKELPTRVMSELSKIILQ